MKKYLFFAASALALASCSSDDFVGDNSGNLQSATTAINFGGETGKTTRANQTGEVAANALKKHFVVFGDKTNAAGTQAVYDHYDVRWIGEGVDNKTQTNKYGWEYVGYTPNKNSSLATDAKQSIKYWDYSATEYNFAAFSLGNLTDEADPTDPYKNQLKHGATGTIAGNNVKISQIKQNAKEYSVEGAVEDIIKLYISDRITAKPKDATTPDINYQDAVKFNFRALKTLVRMGIFETVNGYSVKNVKFYKSDNTKNDAPSLYATDNKIPAGKGKATITFGEDKTDGSYNKALVTWDSETNAKDITFKALTLKDAESKEEAGNNYLGRTSVDASLPDKYNEVIPSAEIGKLTLKVDYTLVSTDGSKEEINVTGATAVVPAEYTKWQPNYSYTYIFKISDKTNGNTGDPTKPGLYPIVFDAVVTETSEGIQNTITTVATRSITTYAKGNKINDEYKPTDNIYASVTDETTGKTADLYVNNTGVITYYAQLYKLTAGDNITEAEAEAVINATGMTLGGKTLVKDRTYDTNTLDEHFVDKIAKEDATDDVEISGKFFKFNVPAGTYVFAYDNGTATSYKVIKVTDPTVAP